MRAVSVSGILRIANADELKLGLIYLLDHPFDLLLVFPLIFLVCSLVCFHHIEA